MSDGGISFASAFGFDTCELREAILVRPGFTDGISESRRWLNDAVNKACARATKKKAGNVRGHVPPEDLGAMVLAVCKGEEVFRGWYVPTEDIVNAAHDLNNAINNAWYWQMGMRDDAPRGKNARKKEGLTQLLTPEEWLKIRDQFRAIPISLSAMTSEIWREKVDQFMRFLTGGELPESVSMDKRRPRLNHRVAGNVVWFVQQVLGVGNEFNIDVCSDCGAVIDGDSETHDWCSECGKMRCDSCTTAPHYCTCDYPCRKHCVCKDKE